MNRGQLYILCIAHAFLCCSSTYIMRMRPGGGATSRIGHTCTPRRDMTTSTWRRRCSTRLQTIPRSLTHSKPPPTTWTFTPVHADPRTALISTQAHQTPGYRDTKYEVTVPSSTVCDMNRDGLRTWLMGKMKRAEEWKQRRKRSKVWVLSVEEERK